MENAHNWILIGVILWLVLVLVVYCFEEYKVKKREEESHGVPMDKLEDGVVYYQCSLPVGLIFLSKDKEVALKAYILDGVDIKKLPNSFMFLQDGEKIVPWDPVYLYEGSFLDEEIIEFEELAGKEPE